MRILLDECLPHEIAALLTGHEVVTVQEQGWSGIENGELLRRAAGAFAAFLTVDKHIQHAERPPESLMVLTIRTRSNRIQSLRPLVPEMLRALGRPQPGAHVVVGVR